MNQLSAISPELLIASVMVASTPILLAALGELVVEKAGVLNLGVEGLMIIGAVCGFAMAVITGSVFVGAVAAMVGGAMLALVFAFLTQYLLSNQVATGLATTLFGLGLASLIGKPFIGERPPPMPRLQVEFLSDLPFIGHVLFSHDPILYLALLLAFLVWYFLRYTKMGLVLRAVGENHDAAHSIGYSVRLTRLAAICFGGALAGLGGCYLSLVRVPQWSEGMTAGAGWIALALVVFSSWRPLRLVLGAWLFGGVTVLQLNLQAAGVGIGVAYLSVAPYVVTIVVLVLISLNRSQRLLNAPACLGRSFFITS
ncbi:MAG: ABC transporter permease [Rhodobacteraceae bacterium]|nr:ABC transporter permease [Paracoccaceae bacterium]